jgi:four helix bundle protein
MSRLSDEPISRSADTLKVGKLVSRFRDLEVYKKAFSLSLDIHRHSMTFPKEEQFALTSQMRRASKGICANIAEGFAKQEVSQVEFKRFLLIAQGSATEMQVWLDYALELGYISPRKAEEWHDGYDHVLRMLQKLHNGVAPSAHRLIG